MQPNAPQFPNLRLSSLRALNSNKGSNSDANTESITAPSKDGSSISKQGKNLAIEKNTLTVGCSDGTKVPFGRRFQMDTSGLKSIGRDKQEELENDIRTAIKSLDISQYKKKSHQLDLLFHNALYPEDCDVLIDVNQIPGAREGDLAELRTYRGPPTAKDKKIYFKIKDFGLEARRRLSGGQISLPTGQLQKLLDLPSRSTVWVKLKCKNDHQADLVELHIKDCYVNRGDMWCLSSSLIDSCVFIEQRLAFMNSIRANVRGIYRNGKKVVSGYIGNNTRVVFRSESAKLIFLIQITDEMWHFESNGEKTFHKVVNSLFPKIFKKCKEIGTHHIITIVFCASVHDGNESFRNLPPGVRLKDTKDYYRVVVDQVNILHWSEIMTIVRKEFMRITNELRTYLNEDGISVIRGGFSPVIKSNILEALNFATTLLTDPFKQADLRHTATHVIIISPGSGLYDVDYELLKVTCKKLLSLEMVADLICLARAPLHIVPLFRYLDNDGKLHHTAPTWLNVTFWNNNPRSLEWQPRCKIYDVQMMGRTEKRVDEQIAIDYLTPISGTHSLTSFMAAYDKQVFDQSHCMMIPTEMNNPSSSEGNLKGHKAIGSKPINETPSIMWNPPRSSKPLVEAANVQGVVVSLHQPGNNSTTFEDGGTDSSSSASSPDANESLALTTLKSMRNASQGLTKRIVSRFISDIKTKRRRRMPSGSSEQNPRMETLGSPSDSGTYDLHSPNPTQMLYLKSHSAHDSLTGSSHNNSSNLDRRQPKIDESVKRKAKNIVRDENTFLSQCLIEIENPSVPVSGEIANMLISERWRDIYPRFVAKKYSKWRSFTTPAELPVTTTHFPSLSDFESNFIFRNHSVSLNIDREKYGQTTFHLLRDLIYTRLIAGFQICTSELVRKIEASVNTEVDVPEIAMSISRDNYMNVLYYMIIDKEIHRISCGYNGTIDVQRYLRKSEAKDNHTTSKYNPLIKTRYEDRYRELQVDPITVFRDSLWWNQIDQVLAGYDDSMMDTNKIGFRSKFVILPADIPPNTFSSTINGRKETLTPEEIRLEGLRKLISSISKSKLRSNAEKNFASSRNEEILPEVHFYTGSIYDYIEDHAEILCNLEEDASSPIIMEGGKFNKDVELSRLAYEMQLGERPLKLTNRKWHFKNHATCFVGLEMVNWLIENFSDIENRDDAVLYGQKLLTDKLFHHVENRHGFLDGHYFYQIYPQYSNIETDKYPNNDISTTTEPELGNKSSTNASSKLLVSNSSNSPSIRKADSTIENREDKDSKESISAPAVLISTAVELNLDLAGNSDKLETCIVHYDRVHNPDHCFHIRLEWLTATPKLIDNLVTNWSRLCERYGLRLVEVPWHELCNIPSLNLSHSFVETTLAIDPWTEPEFRDEKLFSYQKYYYHVYLLESCGFLLDNRASRILHKDKQPYTFIYSWGKASFKYAQFIHYTGAYMAEIRENGGLFLAPNNSYISRVATGNVVGSLRAYPKFAIDSERIMLDFNKTCKSYDDLHKVFSEARTKWQEHSAGISLDAV
ncbi:HEL316Wp [Eremothecium sinecaudum]|uniref:Vacuolar membrane-associated protein IML1 n=1 Tax=Eremothecium sinecaudum TaxID=45286 RepID=A0A0X8HT30_9SACH|nr:HEL316Wp [Eremothecium sinecaudum]AMD20965.1 HEL316Wp [Eremothecium sinecaudum]